MEGKLRIDTSVLSQSEGESAMVITPVGDDGGRPSTGESSVGGGAKGWSGAIENYLPARMKLEELFLHWVALPETQELVRSYVEDLKSGRGLEIPTSPGIHSVMHSASPTGKASPRITKQSPPPRSPRSPVSRKKIELDYNGLVASQRRFLMDKDVSGMELSAMELHSPTDTPSSLTPSAARSVTGPDVLPSAAAAFSVQAQQKDLTVPPFYTPGKPSRGRGKPIPGDSWENRKSDIMAKFEKHPDGLKVDDMVPLTKDLCGFPSFFNAPLFRRIVTYYGSLMPAGKRPKSDSITSPTLGTEGQSLGDARVTLSVFQKFWMNEIAPYDRIERFFRQVKQVENDRILREDLLPFLQDLLRFHPGLEFLEGTPEFQEKYAVTVIARIFYHVDTNDEGSITLRELRQSNLVEMFTVVDEEDDINQVNAYFSYEHFYVLYCKFWELDTDHDFLLTREDVLRYANHSLTKGIVDRVFEVGRRPYGRNYVLSHEDREKMTYEDFIYFMLSEEDKTNRQSLRYWFKCVDLDDDGVIRAEEMRYFYSQQHRRMDSLGHDIVPFEDVLCQLADMLKPVKDGEFRLPDFYKPEIIRLSGVFFNVLFNLNKFIAFEQRDPFMIRQQMMEPELTDWDRYARAEYARLAMEEEVRVEETMMDVDGEVDGWYVSSEDEEIYSSKLSSSSTRTAEAPF